MPIPFGFPMFYHIFIDGQVAATQTEAMNQLLIPPQQLKTNPLLPYEANRFKSGNLAFQRVEDFKRGLEREDSTRQEEICQALKGLQIQHVEASLSLFSHLARTGLLEVDPLLLQRSQALFEEGEAEQALSQLLIASVVIPRREMRGFSLQKALEVIRSQRELLRATPEEETQTETKADAKADTRTDAKTDAKAAMKTDTSKDAAKETTDPLQEISSQEPGIEEPTPSSLLPQADELLFLHLLEEGVAAGTLRSVRLSFHAGRYFLTNRRYSHALLLLLEAGIEVRVLLTNLEVILPIACHLESPEIRRPPLSWVQEQWRQLSLEWEGLLKVRVATLPLLHKLEIGCFDPSEGDAAYVKFYNYSRLEGVDFFSCLFFRDSPYFSQYLKEFDYLWDLESTQPL